MNIAALSTTSFSRRSKFRRLAGWGGAFFEPLEGRTLLSGVVVNTSTDQIDPSNSPTVSLRDAFADAAAAEPDSTFNITFSPAVFSTPKTIHLTEGTLAISNAEIQTLTVTGPAVGVTVNAGNNSGVFDLQGVSDVNLSNLTVAGSNTFGVRDVPPVEGGFCTLNNVVITGSAAAGLSLNDGADLNDSLTATNCSITNNIGDGIDSPASTLVNSTVSGNAWGVNAGSGGAQGYGSLIDLTGVTISGNKLGGITADNIVATNSTISGNLGYGIQYNAFVAMGAGTGLDDGVLTNDTIASNKGGIDASKIPATDSRGEDTPGPFVSIANTIVAGNVTSSTPTDVSGAIFSDGHNLIGVAVGQNALNGLGGWVASDLLGSATTPENPQLSTLGNFGGPTFTMLPAASSPVVNAGSNALIPTGVISDQRGNARIFGSTVDISEVEVRYVTITGKVFNDANHNGVLDPGEAGLPNQHVYLDLNQNGKEDAFEPSATTNGNGVYFFTKLAAGTYRDAWLLIPGFSIISPSSGFRVVTVATGQTATGQNFAINVKTKRTGTTIGTAGSFGNSGNTIAKATDGNLNTFFDAPSANGDWVGLDLGSAKSISQIVFAPRTFFAGRMIGGKIQISTTANFSSGVTTIYTIPTAPVTGSLTTVNLTSPVTARYIRYLSPNGGYCNISEFQVFG